MYHFTVVRLLCTILTRGSNCKSIIQATDLLEERAEDTYDHCLLQNIHCCALIFYQMIDSLFLIMRVKSAAGDLI